MENGDGQVMKWGGRGLSVGAMFDDSLINKHLSEINAETGNEKYREHHPNHVSLNGKYMIPKSISK